MLRQRLFTRSSLLALLARPSPLPRLSPRNNVLRGPAVIAGPLASIPIRYASTVNDTTSLATSAISSASQTQGLTETSALLATKANAVIHDDYIGLLRELGLGSYFTPVGNIQNILEWVHVATGLPWWGSIVLTTFMLRMLVLPIAARTLRNGLILGNMKSEMTVVQEDMKRAKIAKDEAATQAAAMTMQNLFKEHGVNPMSMLTGPLVNATILLSYSYAISRMAFLPVPSFTTGGTLWFTDLTAMDPNYILPFVSPLLFLINFEMATEGQQQMSKKMKLFFRALPVASLAFTFQLPAGLFIYFISTSIYSLMQYAFLKIPAVKRFFKIPDRKVDSIAHKIDKVIGPEPGFWDSVKSSYNASREEYKRREMNEVKNQQEQQKKETKKILASFASSSAVAGTRGSRR